MMKKKNVAMAMAAVTVAAPVSQMAVASTAFAAEKTNTVTSAEAVKRVDELLKVTYSDPREDGKTTNKVDASLAANKHLNSVYEIIATVGTTNTLIRNGEQLANLIEKAQLSQSKVTIKVNDKGHRKTSNGNIVATELTKIDRYQIDGRGITTEADLYAIKQAETSIEINSNANIEESLSKFNSDYAKYVKRVEALDETGKNGANETNTKKVVITFVNDKKLEIVEGDAELDFTQPIDANGNVVDVTNEVAYSDVTKSIVGFKQAAELSKLKEFDILTKTVETMVIENGANIIDADLSAYYNGAYSAEGADLMTALANKYAYKNGQKFVLDNLHVTSISHKDGVYSIEITGKIKKESQAAFPGTDNLYITVKTTNQAKLQDFRRDINDVITNGAANLSTILSTTQRYETLAGKTRFETAVKVSEKMTKTDAVVLVGWDAITDGLAAAPFAKEKNAPILLSKKDEVPTVVMDRMKEILKAAGNDTVYVIGGEDVISETAITQLLKELKDLNKDIKIERIAGKNRYETSVEIAKKMDLTNSPSAATTNAYIVGGFGEADAMSIAPLAAKQEAPIIVSPESGLTDSAKNYIERETTITDVKVIGGTSKVSSQVMADVNNAVAERKTNKTVNVERVAGSNRKETNAKVLKMFCEETGAPGTITHTPVDKILVAKDGMTNPSHLVDALTAAVLAKPIVLNTNGLSQSQEKAIDHIDNTNNTTRATQVGLGLASTVMDKIVSLLTNGR